MRKTRDDQQSGPTIQSAMPAWATGRSLRRPRRRRGRVLISVVLLIGIALATYFFTTPEAPFSLNGEPLIGEVERVLDGDTIDIAGQRIRLPGLDAPEWNQTCGAADGSTWQCGSTAARRMRELTRGIAISCQPEGHDRYGRLLAVCRDGKTDIAEALVGDGLAVSTGRYARAEAIAREARRGLWQARFDTPAEWRRREASGEDAEAGNPSRFDRFLAWLRSLLPS
jgi:endonuclease YncB( thermonuclease family)